MTPLSIYTLILRCVCWGVYSVEYVYGFKENYSEAFSFRGFADNWAIHTLLCTQGMKALTHRDLVR